VHISITWIRAIQRGTQARQNMKHARWRFQQLPTFHFNNKIVTGGSEPLKTADQSSQPFVSILIPAWNERGTIEKCIRSLQRSVYKNWEVIILAGGPDGTFESAKQFTAGDARFRIIERGPEPKNAAINRGTLAALYKIIVLLDADSEVEPGWLEALVEPLTSEASASIGMHYPSKMTWVSMGEHMDIIEAYHILGSILGQGCSSLAIRREVLERIGPLPVNAYSWEDTDIGVRLAKSGEKVVFVSSARLTNERPATLRDYWKTAIRVHRSHLVWLWYWRMVVIKQPKWLLFECYFQMLSVILLVGMIAGIGIAIAIPTSTLIITQISGLVVLWMFGRRAALSGEIAAYTRDIKWLLRVWIPPALLLVQLITADIALLTVWRAIPFDYKGHRDLQIEENLAKQQ
jgi:cellulose synthase/poly-beta-1,6-N-acetylglucosamine synthase-like glycosyltransferase